MKVIAIWRDCTYKGGKWGNPAMDAFWVGSKDKLHQLGEPDSEGFYWFLVHRDGKADPFFWHYPYSHMWNGASPFERYEAEIISFKDVEGLKSRKEGGMKIDYSSNDGVFEVETIRKGEVLDRIRITKNVDTKEMSSVEALTHGSVSLDTSELGFAMMLVLLAKADPQFYEMVRKIYSESHPMRSVRDTIDDLHRIKNLENAIREHRDNKGHDRCWENDVKLYKLLPETPPASPGLPPRAEFERGCKQYTDEQYGTA